MAYGIDVIEQMLVKQMIFSSWLYDNQNFVAMGKKIYWYAELKTFGEKADGYFQNHREQHSSIAQILMGKLLYSLQCSRSKILAVGKADTNPFFCRAHILGGGDRQ